MGISTLGPQNSSSRGKMAVWKICLSALFSSTVLFSFVCLQKQNGWHEEEWASSPACSLGQVERDGFPVSSWAVVWTSNLFPHSQSPRVYLQAAEGYIVFLFHPALFSTWDWLHLRHVLGSKVSVLSPLDRRGLQKLLAEGTGNARCWEIGHVNIEHCLMRAKVAWVQKWRRLGGKEQRWEC